MKRIMVFLMFAMTVVIAASNVIPERMQAPDVDVGIVIDINDNIDATAMLSENVIFTLETIGNRQEGVVEATIRSGPITSESIFVYNLRYLTRNANNDMTLYNLRWQRCDVSYISIANNTKAKPAVVLRV